MTAAFVHLDRILRGDATRPERLRARALADLPVGRLALLLVALAASYGLCMGVYSVAGANGSGDWRQPLAGAMKVPLLFGLTLFVTLPSLYVFNALLGSRLTFAGILRLTVAAMGVTMAVLSSVGPIVAFFSVTTSSYPFMLLLNVFVCGLSGLLGLGFLRQTLGRMASLSLPVAAQTIEDPPPSVLEERPIARAIADEFSASTRRVFSIWMLVFGLVGAQMAWILRPFLGAPGAPFEWLRPRGSNFFVAVWGAIEQLMR